MHPFIAIIKRDSKNYSTILRKTGFSLIQYSDINLLYKDFVKFKGYFSQDYEPFVIHGKSQNVLMLSHSPYNAFHGRVHNLGRESFKVSSISWMVTDGVHYVAGLRNKRIYLTNLLKDNDIMVQ